LASPLGFDPYRSGHFGDFCITVFYFISAELLKAGFSGIMIFKKNLYRVSFTLVMITELIFVSFLSETRWLTGMKKLH
jgi:hypothetical protein